MIRNYNTTKSNTKKKKEQLYFYHKTDIDDVFIITLHISCEQPALLQYHLFFLQLNATQSTGRAMNNKGPYEKDIRVFMRVCRRMSLDTCAWYFYTMSSYLWAALCISEHFIVAHVNIKTSFQVLMVKYQIAQQVFKRNFDRFSIACDHSSIIIIIIIKIITTTTITSLYFLQK